MSGVGISPALANEVAETWETMAEMEPNSSSARRETLRQCADMVRMLANREPLTCPHTGSPLRYCSPCKVYPCPIRSPSPTGNGMTENLVARHVPPSWFRANTRQTTMAFLAADRSDHQFRPAPLTEGERPLGWFVLPPFQRPPVWTAEQKVRFIESCWMGLPLGVFIFNRPQTYASPYENWLLDGQQRVTAVLEYMADGFPVFERLFSELTEVDHRFWDMGTSFSCLETSIDDEAKLRDVYDRLAYGGTAHEPKATGEPR